MELLSFMSIIAYVLVASLQVSIAVNDTITQSQVLRDGMTVVSSNGIFELGFFTPGDSRKRYLGIWYKNISVKTVVWVANRLNPINDSSGFLTLKSSGNLVLSQNDSVVWSTNTLREPETPITVLLDNGNLVVQDTDGDVIWQSFDYPTDTMLPGMTLGWDRRTDLNRSLTAWKSPDDPAPGDFYWSVVLNSYPEIYLMKGTKKKHRSGPWNGERFSGELIDDLSTPYNSDDFHFISGMDAVTYIWSPNTDKGISIMVLDQTRSVLYTKEWSETDQSWKNELGLPQDSCDQYGICGAFGSCTVTSGSQICQCLKGFSPTKMGKLHDWSQGCTRNKPFSCEDKQNDEFVKLDELKVPDTTHTLVDYTIGLEECRAKCLNNCSCTAYANTNIKGTDTGCVMWFGDLIDIRQISNAGQNLYIRIHASELVKIKHEGGEHGRMKNLPIIAATTVAAICVVLFLCVCYICRVRRNKIGKFKNIEGDQHYEGSEDDVDLPLIGLSTISMATDNFSTKNKIGEGGFGPVYKGILVNGQEIAVKKLSICSKQGTTEFKNEVKLIAKVQHRNLVRLLGCCIHGQDKMLVYEYMPNNSLDSYIFDGTKGKVLHWSRRFHIICGIARGLMYLHQDSRLRIIHRDLKASNILLDDKLNPKISDFGMARTIGGDQTEGNTNRIVGTYGYMAPEYIAAGLFSVKSDVFSFGILLLEIIYGKKNRGFYHADHTLNLIGQAWILWTEGKASELIDQNIEDSSILPEVLRCIHIGLLCVQQHPEDRPTMSSVVLMLGSETELAEPKEPGFFPRKGSAEANSYSSQQQSGSTNEMTITLLEAR